MRLRRTIAALLVSAANRLVKGDDLPGHWPLYRPVDTHMPGIGHEYACGAYSYEHLKSLVEQDGPNGFGARATVGWLISKEGWKDVANMDGTELRRTLAMSGIDMGDNES